MKAKNVKLVNVFAPDQCEIGFALAGPLQTAGMRPIRDAQSSTANAAVVVVGEPSKYGIDPLDIGDYVHHVIQTVMTAVATINPDSSSDASIVLVAPPLSATFEAGPTPISAVSGTLMGLCRGLVHDLGEGGARVNVVQPGLLETRKEGPPAPRIPLARQQGRCTTPADIAETVAFLLSPEASYITGVQIDVDGGLSESREAAPSVLWSEGLLNATGPGLELLFK